MSEKVDFDNYVENYNALLHEKTRFFSSSEEYFAKYKIAIARDNISQPVSRLLEYGCGIGRNIPFLQAAFPVAHVVGSDISSASLSMAKNQNPDVEFFQEDEIQVVEPFDLIFVAGVFHHIAPAQRQEAMTMLFERLAPGGQVILFEHNPFNPITRKIVSTCPYDEDAILLRPTELKNYLKAADFFIESQSFCLFFPPRFAKLTCLERYLGWFPMGGQYWIKAKRTL